MSRATFRDYAPYLIVSCGVSLHMMVYGFVLHFWGQSIHLVFVGSGIAIALIFGVWAGAIHAAKARLVAYPAWGLIFAILSGMFGTLLCFFYAVPGCQSLDDFFNRSWEDILQFVITMPLAFAAGAFGGDRGVPPTSWSGQQQAVGHHGSIAAKSTIARQGLSRFEYWTLVLSVVGIISTNVTTVAAALLSP